MTRIFAGLMLALLVACTQKDAPVVVVLPAESYRDPTAQIASQTDVTANRMAGDWAIRQRFASQSGPASGMSLSVLPNGALQWTYETDECLNDVCMSRDVLVFLEPTGPGRWTPRDPELAGFDDEIWVMWMDFDTRTATLGTPSGEFGWIMDKNTTGGRDRITAARDIMDWFGYDVQRLEEVRR